MRKLVLFLIVALYSNFSSGQIIVSELCDPNTDWASNRFVEIFNPSSSAVSLTGWTLEIHTNLNAGSNYFGTVDLSTAGTIAGNSAMIIASPTASNLTSVDFPVFDQSSVLWSDVYINWNGQERDGVVLKENGVIVDYVIADNTSGSTASFFANGTLVRNPCIKEGNPTYDAAEWTYTASSFSIGSAGPSNASPGFHYYTGFDYSVTIQDETCDGNSDGFVVAVTDPATGSYNYDWEEAGGGNAQSGTNNTYNFLPPGTYNITVSNGLGCSYGESFSISQGDKPDIDNATAFAFGTCSGVCDASYTFSVSAGTPPMTVLWTGPTPGSLSTTGGAINLTGLCPGNYSVSVTDDNGCQDTQAFQAFAGTNSTSISGVSPSNASTSSSADGTAALNVSGATVGQVYQYAYQTPPNTGPVLTSSTNPITGLVAGLYSLTATTIPGGCSDVSTFTVGFNSASVTYQVEQPIGNVIAGPTYTLCPETTAYIRVFLNGSPLNTSTWTINWNATVPGGNTPPTIGSTNPAGVFLNDYAFTTVSGTATNGSTTITLPPITINTYSNPLDPFPSIADMCAGDPSVTFSSPYNVGGINYPGVFSLFQVAGNVQVAGPSSSLAIDPSALNSGSHRLEFEFTDPTSGCSFDGETTFVINPTPDFTVTNPPTECAVGASTIDLSGYTTWVSTSLTQTQSYYSYSSTPGLLGSNFDPTVAGVGTYNVTVTYQIPGGCSDQEVINITVDTGPNLSSLFPSQPVSVCGGNTLNLPLLNPSDSWSGLGVTGSSPSFVFDASLVSNGNFQVTYNESGNPCTSTLDINVTPSVVANFQPVPNSACINDATFQLTQFSSTGGSGTGTESFTTTSWPAGGVPLTVSSTGLVDLSNAVVGPYTIQYTYTEGSCTDSETASIVIQSLPQVLYTSTSPISLCSDASVDLGPLFFPSSGGTFTVNGNTLSGSTLSGSASFLTPTGNTVVYSYTDPTTQCSNSATQTFDLLVAPLFNGAVFNESCPGENDGSIGISLTAGATINMTYDWSNGYSGTPLPNVGAGTYTVTVSNNGGCSTVSSFVVTAPSAINNTPTISHVTSNGGSDGSINLTVSGGTAPYSYNWSAGLPPIEDQVNLTAGTYSVTITDANGCSDVLSSLVVAQPGPLVAQGNQSDVLCFGDLIGSIDVTASGGFIPPDIPSYQYVWSTGSTSEDLLNVGAGIYQVTVTAIPTSTDQEVLSFTITQPSSLSVVGSVTDIICFANSSGAISTTVSGGVAPYTYDWSNGFATPNIAGLLAGTYSLTVTDNNGCSTVSSFVVTAPSAINNTPTISHVTSNGGSDGSINLTVSGGTAPYSYNWSAGLPPIEDQVNLTAGTYSVTITDANGCSDVLSSLVVAQPGPLVAQGNQSDVLCFGDLIGSIDVTASGGFIPPDIPSYQYVWSTGSTSEDLLNVGAGIYQVTVTAIPTSTDQEVLSFTITQPSSLSVVGSVTDIICFANSSGAISTTVSGGVAPYTYDWSNGFATPNIAGLLAGTYSLTVTDNNGCSSAQSWTINQPIGPFDYGFTANNVACFGDSTGSIQLNMFPGATPPFSFLWSNGSTTQDLTGVPSGLYSVVITDANGCSTVAGAPPVAQPSGPVGSTGNVSDVSSFGAGDGAIVLSTTGGSPGYNYSWIGPNGSFPGGAVISGLDGGTYSVTTTDANGCSSISTFTVNEPGQLIVSGIANDETCHGTADGSIDLSISSNGIPSIIWSNGSTIEDLFGLAVGTYSVTVTDGPQIASLSFTIGTATILNFSLALPTDSFCLADALPLTGTTSNVGATESYKIDGTLVLGTSVPLSTYTVGTHELRYIVSLAGCTDSVSVLFELLEPYPTVPQSSAIVCPTGVNVNLTSLLNGAAMLALPDTGRWFDPSGLSVTSTFDPSAGPYGVYQYQISNFCGTTIYTMDVGAVQNTIAFSTPDSLCQNESFIDLNNFVLPAGGTWSGGTTTGLFDPGLASPGAFWFYYSVTSAGCTFTDSIQIQVVASPLVAIDTSLVPVLCTANNSDTLSFGSPPGGVYSSTTASIGQSGLAFILDPQASGAGTHDIQYYFTDALSGCSDSAQISISISATINTAIGPFSDTLCVGDLPIPLPVGLPTGGSFSGPGVVGNNFSPAAAGVGSHYLQYSFAGDPCYISDSISIVVTDVPSINLPTVPDLCSSDPAFSLTGASPVGGTWIGNNVVNGQFLPALAGPGTHEIVYYYNSGGNCGNYDTTFVTVLSGTSLTLSPLGPFCEGDANLSLSNVSPSGGTYSGPGVVNGVFSPQNAGVGSHSISYTYTNAQGCLTDTIFNILVQPLPMVTLSGQPDFCEGDPPSLLSGGSPAGGIYTGSGVINDTLFDPFVAGQGSHLLTYTYTDSSGCSASISTQIQVYPTPPEPSINKTINFLVCDWGFYDYQWFFDGDSIPNSNNIKWTAADTGYYQVMLINEWGCTNISDSLFVDIIYPTNLSELEWPELQIYPNPTRGTVSLNLPLRAREIQYKWVNPMGQSLDEGYIPSGDPIQWQYNLSRFASGTYVLVLKSENQILHLRVVLEH